MTPKAGPRPRHNRPFCARVAPTWSRKHPPRTLWVHGVLSHFVPKPGVFQSLNTSPPVPKAGHGWPRIDTRAQIVRIIAWSFRRPVFVLMFTCFSCISNIGLFLADQKPHNCSDDTQIGPRPRHNRPFRARVAPTWSKKHPPRTLWVHGVLSHSVPKPAVFQTLPPKPLPTSPEN